MRLDLHLHTTASDGRWSPEALVEAAVEGGLDVVAITDHDTTAGVSAARRAAAGSGLTVISGAELSSTHGEHDIHILAYGMDPDHPALMAHEGRARRRRTERIAEMVDRLRDQGVPVELEDVLAAAGAGAHMVGRPHLAQALVDRGVVASVDQAFDERIGDGHPAFVPTDLGSPQDAVETILEAGGVPIWAHPPEELLDTLLGPLVRTGLQGLEAFRPRWSQARQRRMSTRAKTAGLIRTGGSDWHGPEKNGRLGDFWVPGSRIPEFVRAFGLGD